MKQGSALLAAGILLLGAVGLLTRAKETGQQVQSQAISAWLASTQLGAAGTIFPPEKSTDSEKNTEISVAENAESVEPEASSFPQQVPVTEIAEAWDEAAREHETLPPSPSPIAVDDNISLEIRNETDYAVDFTQLPDLMEGLNFQADDPVILLMHTHGSESYEDPNTGVYRTQDPEKSVIKVAEQMKAVLEGRGYQTVHDTTICDEPDFNHAYQTSRWISSTSAMVGYSAMAS